MEVVVFLEQRFFKTPDGCVWTENQFDYCFWERYLIVFSSVRIVARVGLVVSVGDGWKRVDGDFVRVHDLPYYLGPIDFLFKIHRLIWSLLQVSDSGCAHIYRIPGVLSFIHYLLNYSKRRPFGVEVVGDPCDVFSKTASTTYFGFLFKISFSYFQRLMCKNAASISYVTQGALQARYPAAQTAFSTNYSSIDLLDSDFKIRASYHLNPRQVNLLCIGNLSQPYKGCDLMLNVLSRLNSVTKRFTLTWIGGGALLSSLKDLAASLGVSDSVIFHGNVSDRNLINFELDKADVFLLPSRQEGLPRVLIEAMARSLVCLANNVGGVSELVEADFITRVDDIDYFVQKIEWLLELDKDFLLAVSRSNFQIANRYTQSKLKMRRLEMYSYLKEKTYACSSFN